MKKKLITALGDKYSAIECGNWYCLYDKTQAGRQTVHPFIGKFSLTKDNKRYVFNENTYDSVDALVVAMEEYNKTLPFSIENYNPLYRKHVFIELCLNEYLIGLGFESKFRSYEALYVLNDAYGETVCRLVVNTKDDTTEGSITRSISESRWQEVPFTDLESAIAACNTLISVHCALVDAKMVSVLHGLTNARANVLMNKVFDVKSLSIIASDAKAQAIAYLEEELKRLKGE